MPQAVCCSEGIQKQNSVDRHPGPKTNQRDTTLAQADRETGERASKIYQGYTTAGKQGRHGEERRENNRRAHQAGRGLLPKEEPLAHAHVPSQVHRCAQAGLYCCSPGATQRPPLARAGRHKHEAHASVQATILGPPHAPVGSQGVWGSSPKPRRQHSNKGRTQPASSVQHTPHH